MAYTSMLGLYTCSTLLLLSLKRHACHELQGCLKQIQHAHEQLCLEHNTMQAQLLSLQSAVEEATTEKEMLQNSLESSKKEMTEVASLVAKLHKKLQAQQHQHNEAESKLQQELQHSQVHVTDCLRSLNSIRWCMIVQYTAKTVQSQQMCNPMELFQTSFPRKCKTTWRTNHPFVIPYNRLHWSSRGVSMRN